MVHKKLFLLYFILFFAPAVIPQEIPFGRISVEDGLSNNTVNCLLQDRLGFLWFGTEDGLNRFDGYDIKIYRNDPHDTASISDNGIWSLFEDKSGFLWIGTNRGELNRYDPRSDKFLRWSLNSGKKENRITAIYQDRKGVIWIGTYKDGLYKFNREKRPEHWQHQPGVSNSLSHNYVTSIVEDHSGNLWISTYNGLNSFNPDSPAKGFSVFYNSSVNPDTPPGNLIWNLTTSANDPNNIWINTVAGLSRMELKSGKFRRIRIPDEGNIQFGNSVGSIVEEFNENEKIIWCGTYAGLVRINLSNGKWKRFVNDQNNANSLSSNNINFIIKDRSGVIWIATADKGLSYISPKSLKFNSISGFSVDNEREFNKLCSSNINAVAQTADGIIWLGSEEGLYSLNYVKNIITVTWYPVLKNLNVWSLEAGNSGDLWIGTYGQGLKQFNPGTGKLKSWNIEDPSYSYKNPSFGFIKSLLQDYKGKIWIGCWGPGLVQLDPETGKTEYWHAKEGSTGSLNYGDVWDLYEDSRQRIWIGTNGGGLNLYDDEKVKFFSWTKESGNKKKTSLSDNNILSICESRKNNSNEIILWVGTKNGLNKLVISDSAVPEINFTKYSVKEGLPDNNIKSVLEDKNGNLWVGTNNGISLLKRGSTRFLNFTVADGLKGNVFNSGSALKTKEGIMIFGSSSGLNIFRPEEIFQSAYVPPLLITRFQVFNKDVVPGNESPLKENPALTGKINLSFDQNVFSFQFSSMDFNSPGSNKYAYMMEGFDQNWIYSGARRFITYTNLNPGKYIFRVKGTNSDGVWSSKEVSLPVIISPPWWKTTWAYSVYILLIIGGFAAIWKFQANRTELRNELRMKEFEAKKLLELENLKSRFFANLSHEFRTPLMLIKGPVEQLINKKKQKGESAEELEMIRRNSGRLQELIDQLLELTQLEAASIPLQAKKENVTVLLKGILSFFEALASEKKVNLIFNSDEAAVFAQVDRDKFEKIINNLLSNAFKFTPAGGTVSVTVKSCSSDKNIRIIISDSGIGIPEDQQDKIFNRFYQVDSSSRRAFGGSGIGLSLVKELVDLHNWKISFKSRVNSGTEFTLIIPGEQDPVEKEIKENDFPAKVPGKIISNQKMERVKGKRTSSDFEPGITKPSILVVEDSSDVRKYLKELLNECYNILEAENGESGLKRAAEEMPDLIISDIMMPFMDGLEFCRYIKTNWETSHIPVILLTAKASGESRIEGLETGADDYLTKPFDSRELFTRIKNLLEQRKRMKEKFSREIKISADAVAANSTDNEFFKKAFAIVEKYLSDADFNSEKFAQEMFVSRSKLHRKLTAVTGQGPGEFIRTIRLRHAAGLLLKDELSITQIAFEAGFSSASHFTQAFQQQFGCVPSEFRSKAGNQYL